MIMLRMLFSIPFQKFEGLYYHCLMSILGSLVSIVTVSIGDVGLFHVLFNIPCKFFLGSYYLVHLYLLL